MPSAPSDRPRAAGLVRRVALASALAAALGGATATVAASLASRHLVEAQDHRLLLEANRELIDETLEELEDEESSDDYPGFGTLAGALAHELEDVDLPNARAAVFREGERVAGDPSIPRIAVGTCRDYVEEAGPRRACADEKDSYLFVLSVDARRQEDQRTFFLWSGALGIAIAALAATLSARRTAEWAMRPLDELRDRVRAVDPDEPAVGTLATPIGQEDVDELRRALADLIARLGSSLASARGFAAEAAHELRTPLTTIAGELEMIAESDAPIEKGTIDRLRHRVGSLVALVQRLLVLAQPARLAPEQAEAVDLGDVVREVVDVLTDPPRSRVRLSLEDDVLVRGDSTLLAAMVGNALDNALKFSAREVWIEVRAEGGSSLVEVRDDGPGLPASEREAVFAAFYRTAETRARGTAGYGVGLALIAHVAALHGGEARFEEVAAGARLVMRLPVWKALRGAQS